MTPCKYLREVLLLAALACIPSGVWAQSLGDAQSFAVVGQAGVTAAGGAGTVVNGDVGSSPSASITGFPPAVVSPPFGIHANDGPAVAAQAADVALFTALNSGACADTPGAQMSAANFGPGIHCFSSTADLAASSNMTLTGSGIYIFRVGTSLTANVSSTVTLVGVDACQVYWQVGSAATLNGVNFPGNVIAHDGVTLGVGASLTGRALATNGPVTLSGSNTVGGCSAPVVADALPPTLTKGFSPVSIAQGGVSTLFITLINPNDTVATLTTALVDTLPSGVVVAPTPNASTTCPGSGAVLATAGGATVTLPTSRSIPAGSGGASGTCGLRVDVTAPGSGTFNNMLPISILQTSNGNNGVPANATLTVVATVTQSTPPAVAKKFDSAVIVAGGTSQLVITLINPNTNVANLTTALTDTMPGGTVLAPSPNVSTTCPGSGAVAAVAGSATVTLPATRSIPAASGGIAGSCTVSVDVTASGSGNFVNTLAAGALQTSNGSNPDAAVASLAVIDVAITPVPTLPEWAMIALTVLLAAAGLVALRRRTS